MEVVINLLKSKLGEVERGLIVVEFDIGNAEENIKSAENVLKRYTDKQIKLYQERGSTIRAIAILEDV